MDEYDRTTCPLCGAKFDPLPRAKKRCPACGGTVWVRSGPDGRRYILGEADLEVHDARWAAWQDERDRAASRELAATTKVYVERTLADLADAGLQAEYFGAYDACPACRALAGRIFDPRVAPRIPVAACSNDICRCDYLPVV